MSGAQSNGIVAPPSRSYAVPASVPGQAPGAIALSGKSSADVIDYAFNFSAWLAGTSDTLESVEVIAPNRLNVSCPLTATYAGVSAAVATVTLASGMPLDNIAFAVEVTTAAGLVFAQPVTIQISNTTVATPAVMPDVVSGAVLSRSGNPIATRSGAYLAFR